ncbi:hypothetical protein B0T24DRAFT_486797, partial [Lasiosphaeria ovina]
IDTFADNCEKVLENWLALRGRTTLPSGICSSDPRILAVFKAVHSAIAYKDGSRLSWLAHVELIRVCRFIENIIKFERQSGLMHRKHGRTDASIALDIYKTSQAEPSRSQLHEYKRFARRWEEFAGPSPFLLLIYSDSVEAIV